jgi:hypothetical protein
MHNDKDSESFDNYLRNIRVYNTDVYDQGLMEIRYLKKKMLQTPIERREPYRLAIQSIINWLAISAFEALGYPKEQVEKDVHEALGDNKKYRRLTKDANFEEDRKKKSSKPKPKRKVKCKCK